MRGPWHLMVPLHFAHAAGTTNDFFQTTFDGSHLLLHKLLPTCLFAGKQSAMIGIKFCSCNRELKLWTLYLARLQTVVFIKICYILWSSRQVIISNANLSGWLMNSNSMCSSDQVLSVFENELWHLQLRSKQALRSSLMATWCRFCMFYKSYTSFSPRNNLLK